MSIDQQHTPFEITDDLPWWMPVSEPGPDWAFRRSGEFPVLQDKALIEEEKPDVR